MAQRQALLAFCFFFPQKLNGGRRRVPTSCTRVQRTTCAHFKHTEAAATQRRAKQATDPPTPGGCGPPTPGGCGPGERERACGARAQASVSAVRMKWDERQAGAGGWADVCARVRASAGGGGSPARWRRLLVHAAWWCAVGERPPPPVCERWRRGREGEGQSKGRWRLRWRLSTGVAACVRVREGVRVRALAGALGCGGGGGAPWESAVAWGRAVGSGSRRGGHVGGGARCGNPLWVRGLVSV